MRNNKITPDRRITKAAIAVVLLALILVAYFFDPAHYKITDCAFKHLTGLSCPGCGLTRSFHAFTNFQIGKAFTFHLIGPVILVGFLLLMILLFYEAISGRKVNINIRPGLVKILLITFIAVWVGFWIVRMISEI